MSPKAQDLSGEGGRLIVSHIFISYNQADADFAAVLSNQIERAGIDTWMDKGRLRPGQDWSDEIDQAILNAYALIAVMSPEAKSSEYVTYEWSFALGAGMPVIPVLYKQTTLHPRLARLHYLRFTDPSVRPWAELIDALKDVVSTSGLYVVRAPRNAPSHVKRAILDLDSGNETDREGAIHLLAQTDHPAGREALIAALRHPILHVQWTAALHVTDEERALPVLVDILKRSPDEPKRSEASRQLARLGQPASSALLTLLQQSIRQEQHAIALGLEYFTATEIVSPLVDMLRDPNPDHRHGAALALAFHTSAFDMHHNNVVGRALIHALDDPDVGVRTAVVRALGGMWAPLDQMRTEGLLKAIRDSSLDVRREVEAACWRRFTPEIVPALVQILEHERPHIALMAHRILSSPYTPEGGAFLAQNGYMATMQDIKGKTLRPGEIIGFQRESDTPILFYFVVLKQESDILQIREITEGNENLFLRATGVFDISKVGSKVIHMTHIKFDATRK